MDPGAIWEQFWHYFGAILAPGGPKKAQGAPKTAQDGPKTAQEAPKTAPERFLAPLPCILGGPGSLPDIGGGSRMAQGWLGDRRFAAQGSPVGDKRGYNYPLG